MTATGESSNGSVVSVITKPHYKGLKRGLFVGCGLIIVLLILAVISYLLLQKPKPSSSAAMAVCTAPNNKYLLSEANINLYPTSYAQEQQLSFAVTKIKRLPHYLQDPNCMFVLTAYYVASNNPAQAASSLASLRHYYNPKVGFSHSLSATNKSLVALENNVALLQKNSAENTMHIAGAPRG